MARTVKVFEVKEDEDPQEPIPFQIKFIPSDGGEPVVHEFQAYGKAPGGANLALATAMRTTARGKTTIDTAGMVNYMSIVMFPGDWDRFAALLEDPRLMLDDDLFGQVFVWLTEQYGERPTRRSRRSSALRPVDGRTPPESATEPEYAEADSFS